MHRQKCRSDRPEGRIKKEMRIVWNNKYIWNMKKADSGAESLKKQEVNVG